MTMTFRPFGLPARSLGQIRSFTNTPRRLVSLADAACRPSSSNSDSSASTSSSSSNSSSSRSGTGIGGSGLPPLRYHIFRDPLPYTVGLKLQNDIIDVRLAAKAKDPQGSRGKGDVILLLGRRDNSPNPNELHPEEKKVQHVGANFYITKRGGQVTYHGPGQLVGYPILDLNVMETSTRCYVEYLQATLAEYARDDLALEGVLAPHPDGHVGVFSSPTEKFASIGIHLRHRITSHGFAMNITPSPIPWFDLVLACGLADVKAISIHDLLQRSSVSNGVLPPALPSVRDTAEALIPKFGEMFSRDIIPLDVSASTASEVIGAGNEEVEQIAELVKKAEEEAKVENEKHTWPDSPDLSKRG